MAGFFAAGLRAAGAIGDAFGFLDLFDLVFFRGGFGHARLEPVARRHRRRRRAAGRRLPRMQRRAARHEANDPGLDAQRGMNEPAERDRGPLLVIVRGTCGLARPALVELDVRRIVVAEAGGDHDRGDRAEAEHRGARKQRGAGQRSERQLGHAQHGVADDAAEAGRQRPVRALRQAGDKARAGYRAGQPERQPHPFAVERPMGGDAPAPDRDRQHQHGGGKAEQLHQQVGADGAGGAEIIANRPVGGVAERWVLHRPGGERDRDEHGQRDQSNAAAFGDAAPDQVAQVVRPAR